MRSLRAGLDLRERVSVFKEPTYSCSIGRTLRTSESIHSNYYFFQSLISPLALSMHFYMCGSLAPSVDPTLSPTISPTLPPSLSPTVSPTYEPTVSSQPTPVGGPLPTTARPTSRPFMPVIGQGPTPVWSGTAPPQIITPIFPSKSSKGTKSSKSSKTPKAGKSTKGSKSGNWIDYDGHDYYYDDDATGSKASKSSDNYSTSLNQQAEGYTFAQVSNQAEGRIRKQYVLLSFTMILLPLFI